MLARGYIEGYYGRLLDWPERLRILDQLAALSMTHYFYAPKEDACHRLRWRQPYSESWRADFQRFCTHAENHDVTVIAGIAPGLDFDFASLTQSATMSASANDFACLCQKARLLLEDGAPALALLMDDIDPVFDQHQGGFRSEGAAHAELANRLADVLGISLFVVPRAYADEIADESPGYLQDFCATLSDNHCLVYCGSHIVSEQVTAVSLASSPGAKQKAFVWDNLYANDYCPRRLFVGPYRGRDALTNLLLNPTGMLQTDLLLLTVMQATLQAQTSAIDNNPQTIANARETAWLDALRKHEVPDAFLRVAEYFDAPAFAGRAAQVALPATQDQFEALEHLLWKWKTPLSREWYPHLMGLKQDLLLAGGQLPLDRVNKTQLPPLARQLGRLLP